MYEFSGRIRYSETDSEGYLSLVSLLDYFQDASSFHSEELGVGVSYLKENHIAWVLSAWQIVVERFPKFGEEVVVGTFPYEFKGALGGRNFYMKDASGRMIAWANSLWSLVDLQSMRLVRLTEKLLSAYVLEPKLEMEYASRKISVPEATEEGISCFQGKEITVRAHHLDTNHHVNNGQFIRMAMSCLPEGVSVAQMRAEYKKQAFLGDVIKPFVVREDDRYIVSLRDAQDKPYVNVEFTVL